MNREELIKVLKDWKPELELMAKYNDNSIDYQRYRALDEEIKALEQEPCEDCISRQATVERLCKVAEFMNEKRNGLGSPYVMAALFIQDNKDEFPPVTPKPKTECSYEQIKWERDTAIAQLKELGYGLGEKPKTDVLDKIKNEITMLIIFSRENVIDIIDKYKAEKE